MTEPPTPKFAFKFAFKNWEELTIYPIFAAFWYNQVVVRGKFSFVEEFQVINARKTYRSLKITILKLSEITYLATITEGC